MGRTLNFSFGMISDFFPRDLFNSHACDFNTRLSVHIVSKIEFDDISRENIIIESEIETSSSEMITRAALASLNARRFQIVSDSGSHSLYTGHPLSTGKLAESCEN